MFLLMFYWLLRDFKEQNNTKDLLEEMLFYLEHSRPLYLDKELKDTADLVVDGMLFPEQELTDVITYIKNQDESIVYECRK